MNANQPISDRERSEACVREASWANDRPMLRPPLNDARGPCEFCGAAWGPPSHEYRVRKCCPDCQHWYCHGDDSEVIERAARVIRDELNAACGVSDFYILSWDLLVRIARAQAAAGLLAGATRTDDHDTRRTGETTCVTTAPTNRASRSAT